MKSTETQLLFHFVTEQSAITRGTPILLAKSLYGRRTAQDPVSVVELNDDQEADITKVVSTYRLLPYWSASIVTLYRSGDIVGQNGDLLILFISEETMAWSASVMIYCRYWDCSSA
jgi:hypothetical protein